MGSSVHGVVKVAGRRLEVTEELTGVEQGKCLRRRGTDSPIPYENETRFAPVGGGTRVTWHQESGSLGGVFGSLADTVVAKLYARDVRSNLEHAKALLEAEETR
ncbi:SRPBCC family protein [Rhodococcus koreensis]|uniref:SRPBCC family protein n=1 Tax=Rhodococcus koreensis TaxID=99653 RepID=UPI00210025C6|nr:SRPBCC family protein [Rhodococcus koreensis]